MICLHCGYCCKHPVVIVKDPRLGPVEGNLVVKGQDERCRHLRGRGPGKYRCLVHGRKWFMDSPCGKHGQVEVKNSKCRIGGYILRGGNI
jgi:hypothetical protein